MSERDASVLSDHLFRREAGRMVAALTRIFGVERLALAEDVTQEAFCCALEVWRIRGVPDNPAAWLMASAKNRALDVLRRERTARVFAPDVARLIEYEHETAVELGFDERAIHDEQIRMMLSCCQPPLAEDAQIALILNILCGFGAAEIAAAFLVGRAAVEKRIARGKKTLASSPALFDFSNDDFRTRLAAVRRALYLLFNEGYHGASRGSPVQSELCDEAMRLTLLLAANPAVTDAETLALAALMHLHAARLPARVDAAGDLTPWATQDRSRWDSELLERGLTLFEQSATGDCVSAYHIEAAIAAAHASAPSSRETNWKLIVDLYDRLFALAPSPVVALNRALAIAERDGPDSGIEALKAMADQERLNEYPFYPASLGELELRRGNREAARAQFSSALSLARNDAERRFLERKLGELT